MRFKAFLNEEKSLTFNEVIERIKAECKPFLQQRGDLFLFRGMPSSFHDQNSAEFVPHPTNRTPKDSGEGFNATFNAGIELAFGIKDVRKKSIFATGDRRVAVKYGELNHIFPKGDFKFLWADSIEDSYDSSNQITQLMIDELTKIDTQYVMINDRQSLDSFLYARMIDDIGAIHLPMKHIPAVILDKRIYSALSGYSDSAEKELRKRLPNARIDIFAALKQVYSDLYQQDQLEFAIKSGNEILIHESDGYYRIPIDMLKAQTAGPDERVNDFLNEKLS